MIIANINLPLTENKYAYKAYVFSRYFCSLSYKRGKVCVWGEKGEKYHDNGTNLKANSFIARW